VRGGKSLRRQGHQQNHKHYFFHEKFLLVGHDEILSNSVDFFGGGQKPQGRPCFRERPSGLSAKRKRA
jgi:hypothetical protein